MPATNRAVDVAAAESQRDSVLQPRVARNELPWECRPDAHNPNGVATRRGVRGSRATTPLGLPPFAFQTQGSACRATLSWRTQSRWDCGEERGLQAARTCVETRTFGRPSPLAAFCGVNAALLFALGLLACGSVAQAQQPAPAPLDSKLLKQYESILTHKFSRELTDIFSTLEKAERLDPATQTASDRFFYAFRTGDWAKVRTELALMPTDLSRKIYDKMLGDLTEKTKPNVRLDDVLGLADAVPGELTGDNLRKLGQLLGLAVPANESYWVADRLAKGTAQLGGNDPAKRLRAGRVLLAGGFKELARAYLPSLAQVEQLADEGLRNELTSFLASQQETEAMQRASVQKIWDENLRILTLAKVNDWEKSKAGTALARVMLLLQPGTLGPVFAEMVKSQPEAAVRLVGGFGRKLSSEVRGEPALRTENLKAQTFIATLLADNADLRAQPWNQLAQMLTEHWLVEAENTFAQKTSPTSSKPKLVAPEDLLANAPAGKWLAALPASLRERLDVGLSKMILASANFDQAAERIVEIGKRSPGAGVALAEDFLTVWAQTHNPTLPEALRKKYLLPDDARIPVTPIMMERNIESLARMMGLFRQAGIAPKDYQKVVAAFDLAYSNAEAYRTTHIEKVFGPLAQMNEELFFLILSRMHANLTERWRKMDVQKAGLTRRNETQTLEMVHAGYTGALKMIDDWLTGHANGSRALTLGGTLLTDWGDFEYFQELVSGDAKKRLVGYKEKNLQAQDYFQRGTAAYAKEAAKLAPAEYSIDAHLGWFHSLIGIGTGGQLNLSKAMNRAALTKIRESLLALPGKAAQAHLTLFAKTVNARLADERDPLHEDLKYRYLASALVITKDNPFTLGAEKKVGYFDELLREIRLQTRVDGPNTVGRDQEFGLIVSVVHTEAMGRVAQFGQYLSNDPGAGPGKAKRKSPFARKMRDAQGARDEFELSLTESLSPFFDIKSFTFSPTDVKPRPAAQPGWEETVFAYLLVRPKDASVDKIPPVELELKFVDLSGPVTIPAQSAETVIKVAANAPPRPVQKVEVTQTLDTRQFSINGALTLEIKATATGLVPELNELLDLSALAKAVGIRQTNAHEGLQVKEINTWGDRVAPRSERLWTLSLNGDAIRAAEGPVDFQFPPPKSPTVAAVYRTYKDMDLATLPQPTVRLGRTVAAAAGGVVLKQPGNPYLWPGIGAVIALVVGGLIYALVKRGADASEKPLRARDVFKMPAEVDGFAVVALLRRLRTSPLVQLGAAQQQELQQDLQRVQQTCFSSNGSKMSEADLRGVVEKWLRAAC